MKQATAPQHSRWQAEAQHYRNDGYYVARKIVPEQDIDHVFLQMHRLAVQQLKQHSLPCAQGDNAEAMHRDLQTLLKHDVKAYLATLTLCAKLASLYELYLHPNIQAFTAAIGIGFPAFQTAPVMHLMSHALKVPGGYQGFGAHQDWPTLQGGLDTVTVWIPFVDVDRNLFTMDIIPGSHKGGLYPYSRRDHIFEVDPEYYDAEKFVPMETKRGDIVFMSSFTVHRSSTRGDERLRISTSMRYENAAEPHFIARGYPFAQKRSVVSELITPDFPSAEQVRNILGE